ncbi:hypothetical protein ACGFMM_24220 [Streptomyces sp. NPDC048604]|uniref:hypothetical protein n=1 Tax=Streptomyces sp. NPDC048604 TaxID=3365578 RepID=UPI003713F18F
MLIDGIDGSEADLMVPGDDLLALPGFWAACLMWLCQTEEDEPEPAWFGVDGADVDAAYEALSDPERWPVFRVPFGGGHTVIVSACNLPDDSGTEYFVTHPAWGRRRGHLATLDGHYAGPGLAWNELLHIARTPDLQAPGLHDPDARLLLLLPVLGDDQLPPDAGGIVRDALVRVGVPACEAPRVSEALLVDHPFWEPAGWVLPSSSPLSGASSSDDEAFDGILLCDESYSPRFGVRLAQGITEEQTRALARALGTWPPGS